MEIIVGIVVGAIVATIAGIFKKQKKSHVLTHEQQQDIDEQIAIIQPIIRGDQKK